MSRTTMIIKWTYIILGSFICVVIQHYYGWLWWLAAVIVFVLLIRPLVDWRFAADHNLPRD